MLPLTDAQIGVLKGAGLNPKVIPFFMGRWDQVEIHVKASGLCACIVCGGGVKRLFSQRGTLMRPCKPSLEIRPTTCVPSVVTEMVRIASRDQYMGRWL